VLPTVEPTSEVETKAECKGYTFRYPELEPALRDLLGR
jgi:hypothetical protein